MGNLKTNEILVRTGRLTIMLPGAVMLIIGLLTGLSKMSVIFIWNPDLKAIHAPAMIFGFIGSLIVLERAVAIRKLWAFLGPLFLSVGVIFNIFTLTQITGKALLILGFLILILIYKMIWGRQKSTATAIQAVAAVYGLLAVILWAGGVSFATVAPLAALFLVITIVGERVELGRVAGLTLKGESFGLAMSIILGFLATATILWPDISYTLLGLTLIILVSWLFLVDIARSTIKARGATRYMAVCLLSGYAWLFIAGATWMLNGEPKGNAFDISIHTILLGFVMSMIMAHASVILPAVLRIKLPYRKAFYVPLFLLQASLLLRVVGDIRDIDFLIQIGGTGNAIAIILFLMTAVASTILATKQKMMIK